MIRRWTMIWISLCVMGMATYDAPGVIAADESEAVWVSKVVSVQGQVLTKRQGESNWTPVQLNDTFVAGDQVHVEANSRAGIVLSNDAVLRLDQHTTLVFTEIEQQTTFVFKLLEGAANFFSRRLRSLKIITPFVNGVVEGTEFYVRVDDDQTRIELFEGRIFAENPFGTLQLVKGQGAVAMAGSAPQGRILVRPRDSVQWAMYYPPILALGANSEVAGLEVSQKLFNQGRSSEAIAGLERIDAHDRDSRFFAYRAGLLLHVGRVSEAESDIRQSLELNPVNGDALALEAVIALVQNRPADALRMAQEAVRLAPQSASARIALSYALQADFDLQGALQAVQDTLAQTPWSGVAWARLAELQLSVGQLERGEYAARKAVELNSRTARAHTILGFAYLTRIKTQKAREAFQQAIALDSAAPLPRLGLGLASIRDGDLKQGRSQIEIAAGLDPGNSLIRSYLGKAYFDEKRGPLDERQFEIAKALDPNDPTPWFYDAIRKQSLNRPVEALQDLQKSIELNDNRAVYRSRLLLDEDLAARSASLGRIYSDLDFQELAIQAGFNSLTVDPANYSAHRLLADAYASRPRQEISRVSELLQAQLLQPINITPIQPQLAEANLFIFQGAGPAEPSNNEFSPLFNRNRIGLQASGIAGSKDTIGDEIVLSAVHDNVSLSLGQFYYETDGFRENNDLKHEIYNAFAQIGLTHKTSIQGEVRFRDTQRGDPYLRFDPENYLPTVRRPQKVRSGRLGFHHKISPASDLIGSYIYTDAESQFIFPSLVEVETLDDGYIGEIQYLLNRKMFDLTTGAGYLNGDREATFNLIPVLSMKEQSNIEHLLGYFYSSMSFHSNMTWTLGLSANKFSGFVDREQFNPKVGASWNFLEKTTLRAAVFRVLQDTIIAKQRLEPTQVAGFNQFYEEVLDGGEAVDAWNYGIGIDQKIFSTLSGGIEFVSRKLEVPYVNLFSSGTEEEVDWEEDTLRVYLYASPLDWLALDFGYQFESFDRDPNYTGDEDFIELDTHRFPVGIRFFSPTGIFAGVKATYVDQEGIFGNLTDRYPDQDKFWVFDANIGYRLPRRYGIITVDGKNIFNKSFKFQDTDPSRPTIFPDQQILVKLTLSF